MKNKKHKAVRTIENPFKEPLVLVEWVDSAAGGGWQMLSSIQSVPFVCHTFGWVIEDAEEFITVSSTVSKSVSGAEQVCGLISIPRVAITKMTYY